MITHWPRAARPVRRYHLWPHGVRVLDLGDDVHAAAHLRDFAAHDYALHGVRVEAACGAEIVAYYDGQHQSGLTPAQCALVHTWVRRNLAPAESGVPRRPV